MRRLLSVLVMLTVLLVPAFAQAEKPISLFLDGMEITTDVPPVLENGRTLVPVRALTEALGFAVAWDETTQTVTLTKGTQVIQLVIDKNEAIVNGNVIPLDVPPTVRNGRTVVPIRFVLEQIGLQVDWDEAKPAVLIRQNPAAVRASAIALVDKMNQGSYRAYGELEMSMGNAMFTMNVPLQMDAYNKGQTEMLAYTTMQIMGMEQKVGQALYKGTYWIQSPETGEWTPSSHPLLGEDFDSNPASIAELSAEDLAASKVTLTSKTYNGVVMKVVTVEMDLVAMAKKLGDDPENLTAASMVVTNWFNADGTPHHQEILMMAKSADEDQATMRIEGTVFYEAWNEPIPFPAEITGATN